MTQEPTPDQLALLREAAEWSLIGLLFECPSGDWRQRVASLAADVADEELREAARWAGQEADEGLYHTTFGPGGPAAIREVSHRNTVHPGPVIAELRVFYEAFAYRPVIAEAPDHVAVQAGFIGYVRLKEAYASLCGSTRDAAICRDAADRIMADHLAVMAQPLAKSLEMSGIRYAAAAAASLSRRVGPPPKQAAGPMLGMECADDDCSLACSGNDLNSDELADP